MIRAGKSRELNSTDRERGSDRNAPSVEQRAARKPVGVAVAGAAARGGGGIWGAADAPDAPARAAARAHSLSSAPHAAPSGPAAAAARTARAAPATPATFTTRAARAAPATSATRAARAARAARTPTADETVAQGDQLRAVQGVEAEMRQVSGGVWAGKLTTTAAQGPAVLVVCAPRCVVRLWG